VTAPRSLSIRSPIIILSKGSECYKKTNKKNKKLHHKNLNNYSNHIQFFNYKKLYKEIYKINIKFSKKALNDLNIKF
jgi:hypothetical protein